MVFGQLLRRELCVSPFSTVWIATTNVRVFLLLSLCAFAYVLSLPYRTRLLLCQMVLHVPHTLALFVSLYGTYIQGTGSVVGRSSLFFCVLLLCNACEISRVNHESLPYCRDESVEERRTVRSIEPYGLLFYSKRVFSPSFDFSEVL